MPLNPFTKTPALWFALGSAAVLALTMSVSARPGAANRVNVAVPAMPAPSHSTKITPRLGQLLQNEAGPQAVWVFFTDKNIASGRAYSQAIADVEARYNKRAIERRRMRGHNAARGGALFDQRDLPVAQSYLDAVLDTGVKVRTVSTWLNAMSAEATTSQINAIADLPFVEKVQPVARRRAIRPMDVQPLADPKPLPGGNRTEDYGLSLGQLEQINLVTLHDEGYTGAGVIVGILDTGFKREHDAFNEPGHLVDVLAEWDFVNDDASTAPEPGDYEYQHSHGTYILGTLGAYRPGDLVGGAFDATFVLAKTEDYTDEYQAEEDFYVAGLQFIEANGADMSTSSLGYIDWYTQADLDGVTAVTTIGMNTANDNGLHACTAAGNEYHDSNPSTSALIAPADAFKVITCGAVDFTGTIVDFSSDGPSADGRVKPELLAEGAATATVTSISNSDYTAVSGTSLSTPLVASALACLIQKHPDWTVDEMRNAMFKTAGDFVANGTTDALFVRGYGIVNAYEAGLDCNGNHIPDSVDIDEGSADDINGNGIPDGCDCLADVTLDGQVNTDDFLAILTGWGPGTAPLDMNNDGQVNTDEFLAVLGGWGPCLTAP